MATENEKRYIKEAEEIISKILSEHIGSAMDAYVKIFDAGRLADRWIEIGNEDNAMPAMDEIIIGGHSRDKWVCNIYWNGNEWYNEYEDAENSIPCHPTHFQYKPEPPKQ